MDINIGLLGCVSVGKTTFLNAIAGYQYSDTEIKKTTMIPQVYLESQTQINNAWDIRKINRDFNGLIANQINNNQFDISQCQAIYHRIERIYDLFDSVVVDPRIKFNIYDIPGLNDSASKNIYFQWIKNNIELFDIIIFITDVNRGLNNADEIEILHLIFDAMKKNNTKLICLMNKCDDIYYDQEIGDLVFEDKEQENVYVHANNILVDIASKYQFVCGQETFTPFLPISSENCFIYRALLNNPNYALDQVHLNRLCKNECGMNQWKNLSLNEKNDMLNKIIHKLHQTSNNKIRDTGYIAVKDIIQLTIVHNHPKFITKRITNTIDYLNIPEENLHKYAEKIISCFNLISTAESFGVIIDIKLMWKHVKNNLRIYINKISNQPTEISKDGTHLIDFPEFNSIYSTIEMECLNVTSFLNSISYIKECPQKFMNKMKAILIDKLKHIYDQLVSVDDKNIFHTCPINLLRYLQTIKIYLPDEFETYSLKFLAISSNVCSKHINEYQNELRDLLLYIIEHITQDHTIFCSLAIIMLINKQKMMKEENSKEYIKYLIQLKKLIKSARQKISLETYNPLDIYYEVTNKNISSWLNDDVQNEVYYDRIYHTLEHFLQNESNEIDLNLEIKILNVFCNKKID